MPNYVRWRQRGATYFFTLVTYRRRKLFDRASSRGMLKRAMVNVRKEMPFDMFACVLLPDHLHCLWTLPDDDDDFPTRWSRIKRAFSRSFVENGGVPLPITPARSKKRGLGIWQPRYWEHRVRDEGELYKYRDYIHRNPVKHGYVTVPENWPWSSFHRHVQLGWLDPQWPGSSPIEINDVSGE